MSKSIKAFPNANQLSKLALAIVCVNSAIVAASPTGGVVNTGSASIDNTVPNTTTITQTTDVVSINWDTFNVGSDESVNFVQDSSDVAINNIYDSNASDIQGSITGNGTIFLSNTNGFIFGANSSINTGAFLATTSHIGLSGDTITLTDNPASNPKNNDSYNSIEIHNDAEINANKQSDKGYLAFISNNIYTTGTAIDGGLHADNGEILISNDVTSTIKLAGLNINFPDSAFSGSTEVNLNLEGANVSANQVILTSSDLVNILDSVISTPPTINTEDLVISSANITPIEDTILNFATQTNKILDELSSNPNNVDNLTLDYSYIAEEPDTDDKSDFKFNSNIHSDGDIGLTIKANRINIDTNISGVNLDLTLEADTISISKLSQDFGGQSGLGSLTTIGETTLQNNINAIGDINFNDETIILNTGTGEKHTILNSKSGNIYINGLTYKNGNKNEESNAGKLTINAGGQDANTGTGIYIQNNITGFSTVNLESSKLLLGSSITASSSINIDSGSETEKINIITDANSSLNANSINLENFYLTSKSTDNTLTLNTTESSSIKLIESGIYSGNDPDLYALKKLEISHSGSDTTNILMSGEFNVSDLSIITTQTDNTMNLSLDGDTEFTDIESLDFSNVSLSGNHQFEATGASGTTTASFNSVNNLNSMKLSNFDTVTLNNHISTNEGGLSITSGNIILNDANAIANIDDIDTNAISITNFKGGAIALKGNISSHPDTDASSLYIDTQKSDLELGKITDLKTLTITKSFAEGDTHLDGEISVTDSIAMNNLGKITSNGDLNLSANTSISILDSHINTPDYNISIQANTINTSMITAKNISLIADTLQLSDDLNATENLSFLNDDANKTVNIELSNDVTLSGNIDFLSNTNKQATFTGDKKLSIVSSNENINLHTFYGNTDLSSLSVSNAGLNTSANVIFDEDTDGSIILPTFGLSLLGNMSLDLISNQYFDTTSYGGYLDFSGVNIFGTGELELTFDTGTEALSLGSIGTNPASDTDLFKSLSILSTGKLNLYGPLNITTDKYDFSNANAIELHSDLTLGSGVADGFVNIDFGDATVDGTHSLTLYSNNLKVGAIGKNIALQDLTIIHNNAEGLSLNNDITAVGNINIDSASLSLDNSITSTGKNITINTVDDLIMEKDAQINADFENITLNSSTGNIGISKLIAGKTVTIRSESGYLYNNLNNYISNTAPLPSTFTNITSTDQNLFGLTNIGESVSDPIVINAQNSGTITAESSGTIYIANLANAKVNATGRVIDGSTGGNTASVDAFSQFKLSSLNTVNLPTISSTLGLISNANWEVDENESIRKVKSPNSAPAIYYSRSGWRLGQK